MNGYEDADDDHSIRTGCGSSDRWKIGEDATGFGGAIRDMWNPPCKGDPGKVTDGIIGVAQEILEVYTLILEFQIMLMPY